MDVAVVIPVFNQLDYTTACLESLNQVGVVDRDIIVIDNGSTDGTPGFLAGRPGLRMISNATNCGCSHAWNQGVEAAKATWTVVLNNDVLVAPGWREGMLSFAEEKGCDIVSPAKCDGELDYDFLKFAGKFLAIMGPASRPDCASGVCFMVHRRVFDAVGSFDEKIGRAGYEDDDFFRRARAAGFKLGMTGKAYLHHFGSVTQKSVKARAGTPNARLGDREYFRKKHRLTLFKRRRESMLDKVRSTFWRMNEKRRYGLTLALQRHGGVWRYR
jgi:GT2 family glycosyltransferase